MQSTFPQEDPVRNFNRNSRKWQILENYNKDLNGCVFTLMSYNLLAQDLLDLHRYLYFNHDPNALHWPQRYKLLLRDIIQNRPQILCLQEVQQDHLKQMTEGFKALNYNYLYKKRTGDKTDGCAIFYNKDMFKLKEFHNVEYQQPGIEVNVILTTLIQ